MVRIEQRVIRVKVWREGELCDRWPRCDCAVQGYLNLTEKNDCGKKTNRRRVVREERC